MRWLRFLLIIHWFKFPLLTCLFFLFTLHISECNYEIMSTFKIFKNNFKFAVDFISQYFPYLLGQYSQQNLQNNCFSNVFKVTTQYCSSGQILIAFLTAQNQGPFMQIYPIFEQPDILIWSPRSLPMSSPNSGPRWN